jgi:predicted amidophosphoribosyltransferase
MRNVLPAGSGVCATCKTFIEPGRHRCYPCEFDHPAWLDAVVPITYSEHLGQVHTALRGYKDDPPEAQRYAMVRLCAVLWRFVEIHEPCIAADAGADHFDVVAAVPSSTKARDDTRGNLRQIVEWCGPLKGRYVRLLRATDQAAPGRQYDQQRYTVTASLEGKNVLLVDDTWTAGGHAQSAAYALRQADAGRIGLVVIGRHLRPQWTVGSQTCGQLLQTLPPAFDWDRCAAH